MTLFSSLLGMYKKFIIYKLLHLTLLNIHIGSACLVVQKEALSTVSISM